MTEVLRKFVQSNVLDKKFILTQHMGFFDTGIAVGNDHQFIYRFSRELIKVEAYVSNSGVVTELNIFNQNNLQKTRIPLNIQGLSYIFMQVYSDLNNWSFNKIDLNMVEQVGDKIRDLITANVVDYIDYSPVKEFLLSRAKGRIKRSERGYNFPNENN